MNRHRSKGVHQEQRRSRLAVETLETRFCPACSVTQPAAGVLEIHANHKAAHVIAIEDDGAGNIDLDCDGSAQSFNGISTVNVRTGKGNDRVTYEFSGDLNTGRTINIDSAKGNDIVVIEREGAAFNVNAPLALNLNLGAGSDFAHLEIEEALNANSDVQIDMDLGKGNDFGLLELSDHVEINNAKIGINVRGEDGSDSVSAEFAMIFDNAGASLSLDVDMGNHDDIGYVDLGVDEASNGGTLDVRLNGAKHDDNLTLELDVPGTVTTTASATLDGGDGTDVCAASDNVTTLNCES